MFHGCLVAIVTPMLDDGAIDYEAFTRLIEWHIENKSDGIVVLGTTGESATIEDNERTQLITHAVTQINERVPVIIGTGANSTRHAIALTQQAMELGADAVLLVTPYYNKPTQEGLYQHYKSIAKAVPIPQILYNVPGRTACDLLPETVGRLAQFSNIVALKEATGSLERLAQLLELKLEMDLLSGEDSTAMEFILRGGKGVISVAANIAPKAMHEMCAAALKGNRAKAEQMNQPLQDLYKQLFAESNPIPAKWALTQMGMIQSGIRLPLTPLAEKYHDPVRNAMQHAKVQI